MFNIFKLFKGKQGKRELTEEQLKWNKMWDLWVGGKIESPYKELMTYQSEINNGGHSQYFTNTENTGDIKKDIYALAQILSKKLNNNLNRAYKAYLDLEQNEDDEKAEQVLEECDYVFYDNEEEITHILEKYSSKMDV